MDGNNAIGAGQIAGGAYLGYQGIKHGLPRALGIRLENHVTSKENASAIKKSGNILDPAFGGKGGWSEKIKESYYVKNSEGYVHITGTHPDGSLEKTLFKKNKLLQFVKKISPTFCRKVNNLLYLVIGNADYKPGVGFVSGVTKLEKFKSICKVMKNVILANKTKKLYIPGIDSYFTNEFIPDCDCPALKSTKPVKAYSSRYTATLEGLKKFGLKGIKENKGRVAFGVGLVALGCYYGAKFIKKGIDNISGNKE